MMVFAGLATMLDFLIVQYTTILSQFKKWGKLIKCGDTSCNRKEVIDNQKSKMVSGRIIGFLNLQYVA